MPALKVMHRGREVWRADFWIDLPGRGRQRIRRFSPVNTQRGAEQLERRLRQEHLAPPAPPTPTRQELSLREFSIEFLQNWVATYNRPVEQVQKARTLRKHILPAMGDVKLSEIDGRLLAAFAAMQRDKGLHPGTVNQHMACISKMLHAAEEWGLLERAPKLRKLEVPPPEWDFLQPAESQRLLGAAAAHDPADHALLLTALRTGLRISELLALRWESVDLQAATLRVTRSASDGRGEVGPKTKRERVVELSPQLAQALRAHRHLRGRYVFCDRGGAPLTRDKANWALDRAARKAGLRSVSWRMLRHSCASQLLQAGRSVKEAQEVLGHASITTTLRYAHLGPSAKRDAVAALDDLAVGQQPGNTAGAVAGRAG